MRYPRTFVPALVTSFAVALGGAAFTLAGAGPATSASSAAPGDAADSRASTSVGNLLAGSYRADFGRLSAPAGPTVHSTKRPKGTGSPRVGHTLKVSDGSWKPSTVDVTFTWWVGEKQIVGAHGPSFKPGPGLVAKTVTALVTASKKGYRATSLAESFGPIAPGSLEATSAPRIKGAPEVGTMLHVSGADWSQSGVETSYVWLNGRKVVSTAKQYRVSRHDKGDTLRVEATGSKPGYRDQSVLSASTERVRG